jgi:Heparinase II/III-like protein
VEHELLGSVWLRATNRSLGESEEPFRLEGTHDGYRRLRRAVIHRRELLLEREPGWFEIGDELLGHGERSSETLMYFARAYASPEGVRPHFELTRQTRASS